MRLRTGVSLSVLRRPGPGAQRQVCVQHRGHAAGWLGTPHRGCDGGGFIAGEPAGEESFGYDPILYLPEFGKTSLKSPWTRRMKSATGEGIKGHEGSPGRCA